MILKERTDITRKFYPALKFRVLSPFYNVAVSWLTPEKLIRARIAKELKCNQKVLDYGCGTGTFMHLVSYKVQIVGYDPDPWMQRKVKNAYGLKVEGDWCFQEESFDLVNATWVFHHLDLAQKKYALASIHRVLKKNGVLLLGDWGPSKTVWEKTVQKVLWQVDTKEGFVDHISGRVLKIIEETGFEVIELFQTSTILGRFYLWKCYKK